MIDSIKLDNYSDINIIYEDNDIIVINKEKGMVVHPGNGNMEGKWDSEDDDIIAYHLRWFVDGVENYIKIEGESIWENGLFKEIKRPKSSYL